MGHSRNYWFLAAGDKLRAPVDISATLLSRQSMLHSRDISRKSLFEEEVSALRVCLHIILNLRN